MKKLFFIAAAVLAISCKVGEPVDFSYRDVSFTHPAGWTTETEELDLGYYIGCEQSDAILTVTFVDNAACTVDEGVDNCLANLEGADGVQSFSHGEHYIAPFGQYEAVCADYTFRAKGLLTLYGRVHVFAAGGALVYVIEQTDTEKRLKGYFDMIEQSFSVESSQDLHGIK